MCHYLSMGAMHHIVLIGLSNSLKLIKHQRMHYEILLAVFFSSSTCLINDCVRLTLYLYS